MRRRFPVLHVSESFAWCCRVGVSETGSTTEQGKGCRRFTLAFRLGDRWGRVQCSEEIVYRLVGVLLDQVFHALRRDGVSTCMLSEIVLGGLDTHCWQDRLALLIRYVAERHLGALVLVELELWEIDVGNLVEGDCRIVSRLPIKQGTWETNSYPGRQYASPARPYQWSSVWAPVSFPRNPSCEALKCDLDFVSMIQLGIATGINANLEEDRRLGK